ncbi:hypothetical protein [Flavonifractor plautii]|uniref:hypothetical protein n=1 Tax=Flavonifractor plautii TaxID=292800 RepID=UPI0018AA4BD8|nr:hypothetical protein [Flavonifractor plautii]
MIDWNPMLNWTYNDFINVTRSAFVDNNKKFIYLDVEHSDRKNMEDIMRWARQHGYCAKEVNSDTIEISRIG